MRLINVSSKFGDYSGLLYQANSSDTCVVFMHGTASNFYENTWIHLLGEKLVNNNISLLTCNSFGSNGINPWSKTGAVYETFENCVYDYDLWIDKLLKNKYKKIILLGHSLGTEKAVYYFSNSVYSNRITKVILAGFSDSYQTEINYLTENNCLSAAFNEANELVNTNKGNQILKTNENIHAGVLPKSASSFLNFFSENSNLKKCLHFNGNMEYYKKINVPIMSIISHGHEYINIPIDKAVNNLRQNRFYSHNIVLENTNHDFDGQNTEVVYHISRFILNK